jgi:hypothetical protein
MSCPLPSTTPRPKWESFLSTIELLLCYMTCIELFVLNYIHLCTPNIIAFRVVFLCITINYCLGVVFNTTLCQHHAKIFISFKSETLFHCSGFNSFRSGFNSYRNGINK